MTHVVSIDTDEPNPSKLPSHTLPPPTNGPLHPASSANSNSAATHHESVSSSATTQHESSVCTKHVSSSSTTMHESVMSSSQLEPISPVLHSANSSCNSQYQLPNSQLRPFFYFNPMYGATGSQPQPNYSSSMNQSLSPFHSPVTPFHSPVTPFHSPVTVSSSSPLSDITNTSDNHYQTNQAPTPRHSEPSNTTSSNGSFLRALSSADDGECAECAIKENELEVCRELWRQQERDIDYWRGEATHLKEELG